MTVSRNAFLDTNYTPRAALLLDLVLLLLHFHTDVKGGLREQGSWMKTTMIWHHSAHFLSCVAVDPEPDSGAEGGEDPAAAGADAAGDRGDSASAAASQQRILHAELPEQKTLLHLVVMCVYSLIIVAFFGGILGTNQSRNNWWQTRNSEGKHCLVYSHTVWTHTKPRSEWPAC